MRLLQECQATSIEASTRRESGEEFLTEKFLPLGHDQHQLLSRFKRDPTVVTACFERVHIATYAMAQRVGIAIENHLSGFVERERETSHPRDEAPHETWRYHRLLGVERDLRVNVLFAAALFAGDLAFEGITDQASVVSDDTTIRGL